MRRKHNDVEQKIDFSENISPNNNDKKDEEEMNTGQEKISLNQYLAVYNRKRILDKVIRTWFNRIDNTNPKKTKEEWDQIINKFHTETE
jgi:hypothetical protein